MNAKRNKVIWRFTDGRRGHDAQSMALVSSLSQFVKCEHHQVTVPVPAGNYCWGLLKRFPATSALPAPDLLVGAGHTTHGPMLLARHARGGRAVVLMKPSLPISWFDYCLVPNHDRCPATDNVLLTDGPLNLQTALTRPPEHQGLILIGGGSKHFSWHNERMLCQLRAILARPGYKWTITDSPRTPDSTRRLLQELQCTDVNFQSYADSDGLSGLLQGAGTVWVSEDSMSMIYEALSTGAATGVIRVDRKRDGRLARAAESLATRGLLTLFEDWHNGRRLTPPAIPLAESRRCAEELVRRLGWDPSSAP